jgi:hypothetical protein
VKNKRPYSYEHARKKEVLQSFDVRVVNHYSSRWGHSVGG